MLQFFKKLKLQLGNFSLIKPRQASVETQEQQLVSKLMEMTYHEDLNALFYNPVSKLYVFNMYTDNFGDLSNNLYNNNFHRQIIAINIHAYFLNSKVDIKADLEKIAKCLKTHTPNMLLQHDLYELVNAFEYLKSLEN